MRKAALVFLGFFLLIEAGQAATLPPSSPRPSGPKAHLRTNRILTAQYARELGTLRRQLKKNHSDRIQNRISGLRVKIRALKDDAERLRNRLPLTDQADAFLANFTRLHADKARLKPSKPAAPQLLENDRLHEEALKFVAARNYPEAVKRYEMIVVNDPDDDQAYLLLGHVCLMLGWYDRAEFAYYNAVHIDRRNYDEIVPFYQNLILQSPNDDQAYQFLGYAYVILGDAPRAKDAYQESLRINPLNSESQKGLILLSKKFGI